MKKWVEVKQYLKVVRRSYWDNPQIQQLIDDLEPLFVDLAREIDYLEECDGYGDDVYGIVFSPSKPVWRLLQRKLGFIKEDDISKWLKKRKKCAEE